MLKVERIILKGFTGMGLHEIETFDFSIRADVTIILGGNGCGKTSLLSVYFPIAPNKNEFRDGGSYTNIAVVDDTRYKFFVLRKGSTLVCTITNLDTDTVLVDGVNAKVYNSRVEELTRINKERKELLNGEAVLTGANTEQRRKWFSAMSTSDLSYALDFYRKLRKNLSLLNGAIDHTGKKITDLKVRVVEEESERERLSQRIRDLEVELADLSRALSTLPGLNRSVSKASIEARLQQLNPDVQLLLDAPSLPTQHSLETLQLQLTQWRDLVAAAEANIATYNKELSILLDESNRQDYLMRNHSGLRETIATLEHTLAGFAVEQWKWGELANSDTLTLPMLQNALRETRQWSVSLSGHMDKVTFNDPLRVMEERLLAFDAASVVIKEKQQRANAVIDRLSHERTHFLETQEVNCPRCDFVFRPGINDSLENIDLHLAEATGWLNSLNNELAAHLADRPKLEEDVVAKRAVRDIVMSYSRDPVIAILFKTIQGENAFLSGRNKLGGLMNAFFQEMEEAIRYRETRHQLDKAQREWEEAARAVGNTDTTLSDKINRLRGLLDEESQKLTSSRAWLDATQNDYLREQKLFGIMQHLQQSWDVVEKEIDISVNNEAVRHLTNLRETKLDAYATARDRYRIMESELNALEALEQELNDLRVRQFNNRQMIAAFSPEKGLLSRYIYNSVVRITDMMNKYIDAVWQYPMRVLPCDVSEGDMDYTFPYLLKDNSEPAPDVCKASKAQGKMFNLAYRLTAYKAMNLQGYPLLLDEPSEGMDEEHRHALVGFIKMLANSGDFSQVLVVSHDSDVHSKLNEAAYCVIDPSGVTLPPVYNVGTKIVYAD